jgi:transcription initiation factor IIF auxiliary subunit
MFNFSKKKPASSNQPMIMHLKDAQNRAIPFPVNINATDIVTLLAESIHLAKLVSTEKRDLEVIRNDYLLKSQQLENDHQEIMAAIDREYTERSQMIDGITISAKQLIDAGQYDVGHALMSKMIDLLAKESPLEKIANMKNQRNLR